MDRAAGGAAEVAPALRKVFEKVAGMGDGMGVVIFMLKLSACMLVLSSRLLVVYAVYILPYDHAGYANRSSLTWPDSV